jgi:hypothetical protein
LLGLDGGAGAGHRRCLLTLALTVAEVDCIRPQVSLIRVKQLALDVRAITLTETLRIMLEGAVVVLAVEVLLADAGGRL